MPSSTSACPALIIRPAAAAMTTRADDSGLVLDCPMPWLAGPHEQVLATGGMPTPDADGWLLHHDGATAAGVLLGEPGAPLETESLRLYRRLFDLTEGTRRHRIWNFVPAINHHTGGVENYRSFNSGRHRAFVERFGGAESDEVSAASAVGTGGDRLAIAFSAGPDVVEHYENPLQTPAARYPERYGRNAPLFSRGTRVLRADGGTCWHLSGTASIRSSETVGADFTSQLTVTLENIQRMLTLMAVPTRRQAEWKVFLRHPEHLEECRARLATEWPDDLPHMMFVQADICRRELLLEIEAAFHPLPP